MLKSTSIYLMSVLVTRDNFPTLHDTMGYLFLQKVITNVINHILTDKIMFYINHMNFLWGSGDKQIYY